MKNKEKDPSDNIWQRIMLYVLAAMAAVVFKDKPKDKPEDTK